jgi:predicted nucleic acid-binding Zn ribbon protein
MRPEEIRSRGAALSERVRTQVDTQQRLEIMLRVRRRRRVATLTVATAGVLAVLVGVFLLARLEEPPVITVPPTTVPSTVGELRSLPVEVFMVLSDAYTVDEATGVCEGSGPLAGIEAGSLVHVHDETVFASADDAPTIALAAGEEVTGEDPRASLVLSRDDPAACVFTLPDLGHDIADYENISLFPETDPDVSQGSFVSGQRVVFRFGDSP